MAHDVFLSYAAPDRNTALAVAAALEVQNIRCWIAPRDVVPGTEYGQQIIDALKSCRVMVLVFSDHANASPHVHREVERAASAQRVIIPFRVEDIVPTGAMDYFLGNMHWLDAVTPPLETHIATLVATVRDLLGAPMRSASGTSSGALSLGTGSKGSFSIPASDLAILAIRDITIRPYVEQYRSSDDNNRQAVLAAALTQFADIREKWRMPMSVFEFYITICLEEGRFLHKHEFMDPSRVNDFVTHHGEFAADFAAWLNATAVDRA
jgi:hypothetical protein